MKTGHKTLEIMSKASWYNNWLMERIKEHLHGEILEVGAGIGNFTDALKRYGKVTVIDYDPEYKNANYGDIEKGKYFFGRKSFDSIVCMNVLEHIKDDKRALKNMYSLLRKGGKLILLVPASPLSYGELDKRLGHFRRYEKSLLNDLLKDSGYTRIKLRYLNWLGLIGWFINAKIFKEKIIPEGQLEIFDYIARPFLRMEEVIEPPFGLSVLAIGIKQ